eukprot:gene36194-43901_t
MSFWFNKKKEEKIEESEGEEEQEEDRTSDEEDEGKELDADIEAFFSPSDNEKKVLLANFDNMRKESLFCDVAFICNGVLFRAHKVILSSWSRWMRAFLAESPNEEVLALDIFTPDSFRSVLDYMYGQPLHMTLDVADGVIKVARRLELAKLEQGCWRYLMTILEPANAAYLHELADRYDCPPLKLASWKILQHHVPGVENNFPNRKKLETSLADGAKHLRGTGLMGPGDAHFSTGLKRSQVKFLEDEVAEEEENEDDGEQADEDKGEMPSVFEDYDAMDEEESEYDDGRGEDRDVQTRRALELLPPDAPATEVIIAWARRLKAVYAKCVPIEAVDETPADLNRLKLTSDPAPPANIKLKTYPRNNNNNQNASTSSAGSVSPKNATNNNRNFQLTKQKTMGAAGKTADTGATSPAPLQKSTSMFGTWASSTSGAGNKSPTPAPLAKSATTRLNTTNQATGANVASPSSPSSPPPVSSYASPRYIDWAAEL